MVRAFLQQLGIRALVRMPLLGREMIEAAVRRTTYVRRVELALLLLAEFLVIWYSQSGETSHGLSSVRQITGIGSAIEAAIIGTATVGLAAFVPLQAAISLSGERERGTLVLLLLTPLTVGQLVVQKWLWQVLAAFTLLMVTLPMMAMAYLYGGVDTTSLLHAIIGLLLLTMQASAIGVLTACLCSTPLRAVGLAYLGIVVAFIGVPLIGAMACDGLGAPPTLVAAVGWMLTPAGWILQATGLPLPGGDGLLPYAAACLLVEILLTLLAATWILGREQYRSTGFLPVRRQGQEQAPAMAPAPGTAMHAPASSALARRLPTHLPVRWREARRGRRYLQSVWWRIGCWFLLLIKIADTHGETAFAWFDYMLLALCLRTLARAAGTLPAERTAQTLEVLLTTDLPWRSLLVQMAAGTRRHLWVHLLGLGLLASIGVEPSLRDQAGPGHAGGGSAGDDQLLRARAGALDRAVERRRRALAAVCRVPGRATAHARHAAAAGSDHAAAGTCRLPRSHPAVELADPLATGADRLPAVGEPG